VLPDGVLSTLPQPASFLPPRDAPPMPLIDYELGGIALSDPSQGLMAKSWRMRWVDGQFILDAPAVAPAVVFERSAVTEFSFTFDQNMKLFLTFVDAGGPWYYWYDATVPGYSLVHLGSDVITPKCSLDDKRLNQVPISDIILAYVRAGKLCYRQQRDRFGTEYVLSENVGGYLRRVGMNMVWRFQFDIGHN
jgi:hypothetical protein